MKEILLLVPTGTIPPFFYVLDIIKDSVQLILFIYAVNGLGYAFKNWFSFSSVVSVFGNIKC